MKNTLRKSNFGFTKWCVALIAAGWMGAVANAQTTILSEDFTSLNVGGDTSSTGTTAPSSTPLTSLTTPALPSNFSAAANAYSAGGKVKLGTSSLAGSLTTRTLDLSQGGGSFTVEFDVKGWTAVEGSITITPTGITAQTASYTAVMASASYEHKTLSFTGGQANSTIVIATTAKRAFLDNIVIKTVSGGGSNPTITLNPTSLSGLTTTTGANSSVTNYTVTGTNLGATNVTVTPNSSLIEVSTNASSGFATNALTLTQTGGVVSNTVYVRIANVATATNFSTTIANVSGTASNNLTVSGSVTAVGAPSVIVSPTSATGLTNYVGQVSASTNYTVTGANLGGTNLVVTASTNAIEVSTNSSTGYTNSFSLAPSVDGTLTNTVYVRISALAPAGAVSATVGNVSGVASNNFTVSGTVTQPALTLVLNPTTVAEDAGASASTGTVGIPTVLSSNLVVSLVSSNTVAATVPSTVTITSGETNATFAIAAVPNTNSYANATAVITASVTNYTSASATLTVSNVDVAPVTTISLTSLAADSYAQNFDALGTASIAGAISSTVGAQSSIGAYAGSSTLNGWYATKVGGSSLSSTPATAITVDAGSGTSGLVYNYGAASASDRALGMLASGSNWMAIGALIKNDTGATINSIKVSFTAEFWRPPNTYTSGSTVTTAVKNTFVCAIGKVDGSTITTANFLTAPSAIPLQKLNIVGPEPVTTGAALDGNSAGNQAQFTDVVIPLQLATGETCFVRWSDVNDAANDAGLAIDNLKMTASLDLPAADGDGAVSLANSTVSSPYTLSGIWAAGGTSQGVSVNVTPLLDSTTLTSASVLVPAEFGVPLVGNVTTTGGASGGTATVDGQLITLNGVSITKANPGVINIAGLITPTTATIAAGNGVYPFTVSTAGDGGTLKAVFASPAANVLIPIANIRDIDANGAPVDKNTIVAVEGICTAAPLGGTSFIQDTSYGIAIYPATTTPAFTLGMVAGRKYAVVGTLVDYSGMAEIKPASVSGVVDLGVVSIPTPITITVVEAKAEQYESMLVTIAGLTKDAAETDPWIATKVITVKDSGGNAIDVRIQSDSTATSEPAYPVTITGILAQFSSATPKALTYQIMPRTPADLSFAPGLKLTWSVSSVFIDEFETNLNTDVTYLTLSRVGSSTGAAAVELSISPAGRMLNAGLALPQTINFAAGETSKKLVLTPVNDTVYTGDTVVTLTATASGLTTATATATIYEDETAPVIDTTKPVIALLGDNPLLLANGASYSDPGATVTDNVDALRTIYGTGTVDTALAGDYLVRYNATDAASNAADQVTRTVRVAAPLGSTYSSWLNGASASDAAFLDYVFGAATPGTLDPSLKPTVAVTGGKLVLTYYVRQGTVGLTVTPKASANLALGSAGWSTAGVDDTADVSPITVNGVSVWRHAASVPVSGLSKFLRIEAVQQ